MDKLITPEELAAILRVKRPTIYSWIRRGVGPPHVQISSVILFREKAIETWILSKEKEKRRRNFQD